MPGELTITLDDETRARLDRLAADQGVDAGALTRAAVERLLEAEEALELELRAAEREADKGVFVSAEAVHAWLRRLDEDPDAPFPEPDVFIGPADR